MHTRLTVAFLLLASSLAIAQVAEEQEPSIADQMAMIRAVASGFPPRIDSPEQRAEIESLWHSVEKRLLSYEKSTAKPDPNLELLLGELYRMGYNLDIEGCGEKAIFRLERAIVLMPTNPAPYYALGRHYTYSAQDELGEIQLLRAYALAPPAMAPQALFDLTFNYYHQKKFVLARLMADRYLASHPDESAIVFLRNKSVEAIEQGVEPKVITIETDELPDGKLKTTREVDKK